MQQPTAPARSSVVPLSIMMFLQFFLWGAWFVTLGPFMNSRGMSGTDIGNAYTTAPIAAIIAPFFLGMVADRFFASQRVMAVLHILGGALLMLAPTVAGDMSGSANANAWPFLAVLLAHMLCYMPTLGLSNTVAFNAMNNPEKQFPLVRVWGTIGWIVAGFVVAFVTKELVADKATPAETQTARNAAPFFFYVAGASGVVLGLFSFFLPHTPAPMKGKPTDIGAIFGRDALALLKDRNFAVFALCSLLICIPLSAYYALAGVYTGAVGFDDVPVKMSFGQMSEILFMLVMPLCFARLGVKWMLAVGMLAWVIRYVLFAGAWGETGPQENLKWFVLAGIILHGICYDFFFVTGQIYVEKRASPQIRGQAQGFLVLITQGIGMLIGNQLIGRLKDHYTTDAGVTDWRKFWFIPAGFALAVLVLFVLTFSGKKEPQQAPPTRTT
jgi:nucleoside transporter